jgi:hypothetical protein
MKQFLGIIALVFSVSLSGQITFQIAYGDSGLDAGYHVLESYDQGYLITGTSVTPDYSEGYTLLIKTNKYGDTLWTRKYSGQVLNTGRYAKQLPDSGYIIVSNASTGWYGMGMMRVDRFGDTLWTRSWFGGSVCVDLLSDGGFLLAGVFNGDNLQLIRTDSNGDTLWTRGYGGANFDICAVAKQTSDGGFVLAGASKSWGAGNYDYLVIKTDSMGVVQWSNVYGGTADDRANDIIEISTGGYMVIGNAYSYSFNQFSTDMLIVRLDSAGTITGAATFGGYTYDYGQTIRELPDGKFLASGYTQSFGNGGTDAFLVKLGTGGNMLWSKTYGENTSDGAWGMALTGDGGCVLTGVGPGPGGDVFLVKADSTGLSNCFETVPACTMNVVYPWTAAAPVSEFSDCQVYPQYYTAQSGVVVTPICTITESEEMFWEETAVVYPNPFSDETTIRVSNPNDETLALIVFDAQGRVVKRQENLQGESVLVDGETLAAGIYFFRIESEQECFAAGKLIRE